jgi:hypothetical protein
MDGLISIQRQGLFSLKEARRILPVVRRITLDISEQVDALIAQLETTPDAQKTVIAGLEDEINKLIHHWNEKIKKLGANPKGLWLVDFAFSDGYYCWKYPETDLQFWHGLEDGYSGRRPLEELLEQEIATSHRLSPDQLAPR